jgi:hypothetical protein
MKREKSNLEIIEILKEYFSSPENQDIRFFQGLSNLNIFKQQFDDRLNCTGIEDPYYYESEKVLNHIKSKIKEQ